MILSKILKYSTIFVSGVISYHLYSLKNVELDYDEVQSKNFVSLLDNGNYCVLDLYQKYLKYSNQS